MTKLEQLTKELCPNGVEYKTLGELGKFYGGLIGKSKDDFTDGNAKFITYKNVYSNPALQIDVADRVKIVDGEKQRTLQYGDVIFTGSSETPDECGISSVVTVKTDEKLYLNSFCFFFRFDDIGIILPDFAKHLFRSNALRYQIGKTASGVTRFNVSKKLMENVIIPLPPLPVQNEIVRILDNFTELTAELSARKKQYEYFEHHLLFDNDYERVKLQELCTVNQGLQVAISNRFNSPAPNRYMYITVQFLKNKEDSFIRAIRKFMMMQTLTPIVLQELIDKIEVFPIEGTGKNRTQRLVIHYRFVGCIDLPSIVPKHTYKLDSRQGVAIEYLPSAV